jgi:hypothetical protein
MDVEINFYNDLTLGLWLIRFQATDPNAEMYEISQKSIYTSVIHTDIQEIKECKMTSSHKDVSVDCGEGNKMLFRYWLNSPDQCHTSVSNFITPGPLIC